MPLSDDLNAHFTSVGVSNYDKVVAVRRRRRAAAVSDKHTIRLPEDEIIRQSAAEGWSSEELIYFCKMCFFYDFQLGIKIYIVILGSLTVMLLRI